MVEYITESGSEVCDQAFADKIKEISNADLDRCYQCYTCTAGCPVAYAMDYYPHQVMRMVQLGVKEKLLSCSTIWLCAACETCNTRCPNGVELVNVMDTLREMAIDEGVKVKEQNIVSMHKTFLSLIKSLGRQHEISLLVLLKMKTKEFLKDMFLGMKMFMRGKLKILPHRIKGMDEIKGIFERSKTK
jgi:heterodisulfide reductase subunit C